MSSIAKDTTAFKESSRIGTPAKAQAIAASRLLSIDALRGLVMAFMLVDHIREIVYAHHAVTDPMDAMSIEPALFFTRITSQICAPVFVALTGLSAWLYGQSHTKAETSAFLLKRGLFLIFLEFTFVSFAWAAQHWPPTFWLQVIWAIGLCMIILAGLLHLPQRVLLALGLLLVAGHNLLDSIVLTADNLLYLPWTILHQRAVFDIGSGTIIKISYPILPWIGVIVLGYCVGPWFAKGMNPSTRIPNLARLGMGLILGFLVIRYLNFYGDKPWMVGEDGLRTIMSFMAVTKYPPSLMFLMPTLGFGLIMLALFERYEQSAVVPFLACLGGAPMFFYILHLWVLKALNFIALEIWGANQGLGFGYDNVWQIWLTAFILIGPLYMPSRWFAGLKQRRRDIWWLRYL
jgi:uncharacterized membrane protein